MTRNQLYKALAYVDSSREKRSYYAALIQANPSLLKDVLAILFMVDDERSQKAGWLAEFVIKNNLSSLLPYLDYFIDNMDKVYQDSGVRPVSKICELLAISYYKERNLDTSEFLLEEHRLKMVETSFDWMITEQKVAVKAYTMTTLYYLGTEFNWVHPELKQLMEAGYNQGSAAFKARSRQILSLLERN